MISSLLFLASSTFALDAGDYAPNFLLPAMNSKVAVKQLGVSDVAISQYIGPIPTVETNYLVLYFFDSKVPFKEIVDLNQVKLDYKEKKVQILAIYMDSDKRLLSELNRNRISFPVLQDTYSIVARRYDVDSRQSCFILDSNSKFVQQKNCSKIKNLRDYLDRVFK
ncbi:MAG: redoxin domain-containing protein [Myxococcota bacterium]|nr:redoxin domain-containing protein [Myxococcota bacterium]